MEPLLNEKGSRPLTSSSSMSKAREPVERRCILWIHDEQYSKEEVILNMDLFPAGAVKPGDLLAIVELKADVAIKDFQERNASAKRGAETFYTSLQPDINAEERKSSTGSVSVDGQHDTYQQKRYLFAVKDMSKELKAKQPNLEVSIAKHIADVFGFKHRSNVLLTTTNAAMTTASHVEVSFKDEYLARSDMWRLTISEMSNKTVYKGQKVVFIGTIKAQVTAVYVAGRKVHSAFFSATTKPIFRSESARFVLFIQMSREMWDFDSEGSGEIMFTKVVNGFLPALFKRWVKLKVRHLVSIVLFTRVEYDTGLTSELAVGDFDLTYHTGIQSNGARKPYKDFYRVVVSEMGSGEWTTILYQLKREFRYFLHDISLHRLNTMNKQSPSVASDGGMGSVPGTRIEAEPTLAIHGNILEAINLASSQYAHDYIDRDLLRTGISIVLITPGAGLFEVDYEMLRITTENLVSSGIGIDLVCLPKIPLHSVPLFRYQNLQSTAYEDKVCVKDIGSLSTTPRQEAVYGSYSSFLESFSPSKSSTNDRSQQTSIFTTRKHSDEWSFAIPHWLDVSFWTGASQDLRSRPWTKLKKNHHKPRNDVIQRSKDFAVRCKMYELEMSSITNDGMVEISVAPLPDELWPSHALQNFQKSSIDPVIIRGSKKHISITGTVLGPARSVIDKRSGQADKAFFEQLDVYDRKASILSEPPEKVRSRVEFRKHFKIGNMIAAKKMLGENGKVDEPSLKEESIEPDSLGYVEAVVSAKRNNGTSSSLHDEYRTSTRIDSSSTVKSTVLPTLPMRLAKSSRQISLGSRGFGIAAPKAAAAELQIENVKASVASEITAKRPNGSKTNSSTMASHLLSSPRQDANQMRPTSSQSSLRSSKGSTQSPVDVDEKIVAQSRPIAIKSTTHSIELQGQSKARTMLGSVYEGADANEAAEQLETLKKLKSSDSLKESKSKLLANSTAVIPTTLSPTTALSPWLTILNPSNPAIGDNIASQYKRWQHVFPKPLQTKAMKWKSLCAPASVPLTTEYFPTQEQLNTEYHQQPYNVSQDIDEDLDEVPKSRDDFLRELINLRLSQGFQIVVGPAVAEAFGQRVMKIGDPFEQELLGEDGGSVFMSMGNTIHQLSCVRGTEVEVNRFVRKTTSPDEDGDSDLVKIYKPAVRTTLASDYESREIVLRIPKDEYNWNYVDSFIAGHNEEMTEGLRFWRARFVLIPIEQFNSNHRRRGEDNEEETRLEGIKALTQIWQRHRYIPPSERHFHSLASRKRKDPNPLDIVYQTQDPSVVVIAELETLTLADSGEPQARRGQLLSGVEPFRKSTLSIAALAEAIQVSVEKGGVRMQNRRWHFRLHYNCFIGSDMTTWLLENFEDIETREDAEELGNMLMARDDERKPKEKEPNEKLPIDKEKEKDMGIFVHVEKRHPFRDGQYFYQMTGEHAKPRPETRGGWPFGSRRRDTSMPSTPMTENVPRESPKPDRILSSSGDEEKAPNSGTTTPTNTGLRRPKVALSKVMKYDVDPRKRSYRSERINLHYDRLHNPDNCYHIRIDWMNVTAKLIEDAIQSWATTADRYGLRLIEVPIGEASFITDIHPFRSPYLIQLALAPPDQQPPTYFDATSLAPQVSTARHYYQKAIMRKHNFVLDVEAAENFPANVEVIYSWGRPDYKYTQYIHRSGVLLVQVTDEGNFILLANKLYNNRAVVALREQEKFKKPEHIDRGANRISTVMGHGPGQTTPVSSPMLRAYVGSPTVQAASADVLGPSMGASKVGSCMAPEVIAQELEDFCGNAVLLEEFYKEVLEKSTPPAATPPVFQRQQQYSVLEQNIPALGLPPGLFPREASPSPMRLGSVPIRRGTQRSDTGSISSHDSPKGNIISDG